jgi:nitroimidazol reductase NimA-like FMN-containing flavoprotein (pyridoxamine 5'-phosphate oxidase superfamily)
MAKIDRNGLEVLDRAQCLALLRTATIGRIGTTIGALPTVLPVNFRVVDDQVVFRTTAGTKLDAAATNAVVAFEADAIDAMSHGGWSVVVTGIAREVVDPGELDRLTDAHIPFWAPTADGHVVSIRTDRISGRRITPTPRRTEEPR